MALNDILADDAAMMVSTDEFGESVTYTPLGGTAVTISAVVDRQPPARDRENGAIIKARLEVFIRNHATLGRTSINVGGDTITVAERYGGTARAFAVDHVIEQDAGGWLLALG